MKIKYFVLFFGVGFLLSGCGGSGDIKNNFCGVHINYQYCKCAFHNEFCDAVNMSKGEANAYVYGKYNEWKNGGTKK